MELNYLREFVILARNCHFQEAAAELFISQSSLSKHIKAIEAELGQELFNRSTRKVELSDFGKAFLPYATKIAEIQQNYNQNLLQKEDSRRKHVCIGISELVTLYNMQDLLVDFSIHRPEYKIEIIDLDDAPLHEVLGKGKCDLVIAPEEVGRDLSDHCSLPYTRDTLVAILPIEHPLASASQVSVDQLRGSQFIQLGRTNLLHLLDPTYSVSYTVSRSSALMRLIARGAGVGIITKNYARYTNPSDVCVVPIVPETILQMNIYYLKQQGNSTINYIVNWFQNRK